MPEPSRVQRWRDDKRQRGLKAVTIWLTGEEELRLKDLALQLQTARVLIEGGAGHPKKSLCGGDRSNHRHIDGKSPQRHWQ